MYAFVFWANKFVAESYHPISSHQLGNSNNLKTNHPGQKKLYSLLLILRSCAGGGVYQKSTLYPTTGINPNR